MLLTKLAGHSLLIVNTVFQMKNKYKGTWQHSRSKHWRQLYHLIIKSREWKELKRARDIISYDNCLTDHRSSIPAKSCYSTKTRQLSHDLSQLTDRKPAIAAGDDMKNVILNSCKKVRGSKRKASYHCFDENAAEIKVLAECRWTASLNGREIQEQGHVKMNSWK